MHSHVAQKLDFMRNSMFEASRRGSLHTGNMLEAGALKASEDLQVGPAGTSERKKKRDPRGVVFGTASGFYGDESSAGSLPCCVYSLSLFPQ